jgi:vancomycin resistance protein YoaR
MKQKKYKITFAAKILILQLVLSSIAVLAGFTWRVYAEVKKRDNVVYPGISIANLDLSGKTKAEGISMVKSKYVDELFKRKIKVQGLDKVYVVEGSKLISNYNIDSAVTSALNYGKNLGLFEKGRLIRKGAEKEFKVSFSYNEAYIKEFVTSISGEINKVPINATVEKMSDGSIKIIDDITGYKVENEKLESSLKEIVSNEIFNDATIKVPVQELHAAITKEMLNTIDYNIASFYTNYLLSSPERTQNIELAARFINGKCLQPGEIFSFNNIVGERTKERGFKEAAVIVGNKVESGYGGGICQVSSTLYNAVLKTGLKPVERAHHTLPAAYVDLGLDATVDWGSIDFKFKNTFNYPIYIEANTKNKVLYINIYSNSSLSKRKYVVTSNIYKTIQTSTKTIDDPNLPVGKVEDIQKGYDGYRVKVIRNALENGIVVNSEIISDDYYTPVIAVVKVGIKQE